MTVCLPDLHLLIDCPHLHNSSPGMKCRVRRQILLQQPVLMLLLLHLIHLSVHGMPFVLLMFTLLLSAHMTNNCYALVLN